jgi:hypothetical protein
MSDERMVELLEELTKWARFQGAQLAKKVLRDILSKDAEKVVYQYSDGKGSAEIAALAGVSDFTVRSYWKKWNTEGLVIPSQKFKGRYERIFSLEDFGIEVPMPKSSGQVAGMQNNSSETGGASDA